MENQDVNMKKVINAIAQRLFGHTPYKNNVLEPNSMVRTVQPTHRISLYDTILQHKIENKQISKNTLDRLKKKV